MNASQDQTISNGKVESMNGTREQDWSRSNSLSAGVALNWTLFDGLEMFMTRNRYEELRSIGELNTKAAIEGSGSIKDVSSISLETLTRNTATAAAAGLAAEGQPQDKLKDKIRAHASSRVCPFLGGELGI